MARDDGGVSRVAALFLAVALGFGAQACDRCAGIFGCTSAPRLSMGGQLIIRETGAAVGGAALDFVRTGGVQLASDSVSIMTDGEGRFQLAVEASNLGQVVGDLVVRPPAPCLPYRVRGLSFRTSDVRGEGQILGRMVVRPYIDFIGELYRRSDGQPLAGASVTIIPTGGVHVSPDSFNLTAGPDGRIYFVANAAQPGDMVANMVVASSMLSGPSRLSGVVFPAIYVDTVPEVGAVWRFGYALPYVGELFRRGTGTRSAGIEVDFQRTGGIPVSPDAFVVHTGPDGRFPLNGMIPFAEGDLVGNLIIRPPAPATGETISAVQMRTVDSDTLILLGVWGYGYQVSRAGELYLRGTGGPASGLTVQFRRTGGISITPDSFVVQTGGDGRFPLIASATGAGEVVGDLTIVLPAPFKPDTIAGVRIAAFADDSMRFLDRWGVGPSLNYVGEVRQAGTDSAVVGATVQFQRTGGIQVTPSLLVAQTNADGRFLMATNPLDTGEVVGSLTIHPPAPLRDTTFTGIPLRTFDNDSLRLAGVWRIAPPQ